MLSHTGAKQPIVFQITEKKMIAYLQIRSMTFTENQNRFRLIKSLND